MLVPFCTLLLARRLGQAARETPLNTREALTSLQHDHALLQAPYCQVRRWLHGTLRLCNQALTHLMRLQKRYKMTEGLQPMHANDWVQLDSEYAEEMVLRQKIVREQRDNVIASQPQVHGLVAS